MVDIIIIDCIKPKVADYVLNHCQKEIKFGRSILFTHEKIKSDNETILINKISSINQYSDFILRLDHFIDNEFVLIVQRDGFILNPNLFDAKFLCFDYIGAPFSAHLGDHNVGNGGFSIRSKDFLNFSNSFTTTNNVPEDLFLSIHNYDIAKKLNLNFAPNEIASKFSIEEAQYSKFYKKNQNIDYNQHFGFHCNINFDKILEQKPNLKEIIDLVKK